MAEEPYQKFSQKVSTWDKYMLVEQDSMVTNSKNEIKIQNKSNNFRQTLMHA